MSSSSFGRAQLIKEGSADATFTNPIGKGADPWVVVDPNADRLLWCRSNNDLGIIISTSETLSSFGDPHVIWSAPEIGPYSKEVWAPELHHLDGHWFVYFAASDGNNANHLAYVLKSKTDDPLGEYELHGPLATGDGPDGLSPNVWAIDMTVLEHTSGRYAIWSGWDAPGTDQQFLYIAPMKSPTELSGPRVLICDNDDHLWERTEERLDSRGLHEAPEVLQHSGRTFVTYSTAASWLPTYKIGMLELVGDNPLAPESWRKFSEPAFQATENVFGVGHACFVNLGDQWWHVYHAKNDRKPGWNRSVHVQPFSFDETGKPNFGAPTETATAFPIPSIKKHEPK